MQEFLLENYFYLLFFRMFGRCAYFAFLLLGREFWLREKHNHYMRVEERVPQLHDSFMRCISDWCLRHAPGGERFWAQGCLPIKKKINKNTTPHTIYAIIPGMCVSVSVCLYLYLCM